MKYDSVYYNHDRYYDPTAGAALIGLIREEKERYRKMPQKKDADAPRENARPRLDLFVSGFCEMYARTHAPRANGKPLKYTIPSKVRKLVQIYEYCMARCNEDSFTVGEVVQRFGLGTDRQVRQCFAQRGDIWKIVQCWNGFRTDGTLRWPERESAP